MLKRLPARTVPDISTPTRRVSFPCLSLGSTIWFRPITRMFGIRRRWQEPAKTDSAMESLDQIKSRIETAFPGAQVQMVPNDTPANQPSLLVDNKTAFEVARFL